MDTRNSRRVVITGLGVVAPNGIGKDAFWENLIAGKSATDYISAFDPSPYPCQIAAEVRGFTPADFMSTRTARMLSRFSQFAVAAARLATDDALVDGTLAKARTRAGVCFGTSASGTGDVGEGNYRNFLSTGLSVLDPLAMLEYPAHAATSHVAEALSISGPSTTIASGCATGIDTAMWGVSEIRNGRLDLAVVGAAEAPITEFILGLFSAGNFLATWTGPPHLASRPYDLLRSGLVLGEGAAALILEEREHALARGVPIYGEILGTGSASEGGFDGPSRKMYECTLEQALTSALADAQVSANDIDHINAHGNSTKGDDAAETRAFRHTLAAQAYRIPITSIKGAIGQPLAAGGALQVVAVALSLQAQCVPPTVNQAVPDPECDLDYVPNNARVVRLRNVLVHSHSLGGRVPGSHAAMVIGKDGS